MKRYFYYHLPWKLLMIAIFIQSSFEQIGLPYLGFVWQDKFLHFLVFGILAFLIARSFKNTSISSLNKYYSIWAIGITTIYGILDEFHQYYVPGRSSTIADWIADVLGAICFIAVFHWWEKMNRLKAEKISG